MRQYVYLQVKDSKFRFWSSDVGSMMSHLWSSCNGNENMMVARSILRAIALEVSWVVIGGSHMLGFNQARLAPVLSNQRIPSLEFPS